MSDAATKYTLLITMVVLCCLLCSDGRMDTGWITRKEAAAMLAVSVVSIDRWIKAGRITATRITPKVVRVSVYSIDRLLQQGKR